MTAAEELDSWVAMAKEQRERAEKAEAALAEAHRFGDLCSMEWDEKCEALEKERDQYKRWWEARNADAFMWAGRWGALQTYVQDLKFYATCLVSAVNENMSRKAQLDATVDLMVQVHFREPKL